MEYYIICILSFVVILQTVYLIMRHFWQVCVDNNNEEIAEALSALAKAAERVAVKVEQLNSLHCEECIARISSLINPV